MAKQMRQFELTSPTEGGMAFLSTWLEDDKRLKVGTKLTLKDWVDSDRLWEITFRGDHAKPQDKIHKGWKVGGIA